MKTEAMTANLKRAISDVLETMFFQPVQFIQAPDRVDGWLAEERSLIGSTLHFSGPVGGTCYLLMPAALARRVTANFLGSAADRIDDLQQRDTVKEALNMIGGQVLSALEDSGRFSIDIPQDIPEDALDIERIGELDGKFLYIETEENRMAAGIVFDR